MSDFKYARKSTYVEAFRVTAADDTRTIALPGWIFKAFGDKALDARDDGSIFVTRTAQLIAPGNWIVRNEKGEYEGWSDDAFQQAFDKSATADHGSAWGGLR